MLNRWGFTPQKPVFRAYEQSPREVKKWLREQYPLIKQKAQKQRALILWLDELGLRSQHHAGKSFAPKGKTPVLQSSGSRFYLNQISALSNRGDLVFVLVEGNFNTTVFLCFLDKLTRAFAQKILLILDSHPVHKTKRIELWLAAHRKALEFFFLPAYSPDLNVVEYLNQDVKTNANGKARPRNKAELKKGIKTFVTRKRNNPEQVKKYFHAKPVQYAR